MTTTKGQDSLSFPLSEADVQVSSLSKEIAAKVPEICRWAKGDIPEQFVSRQHEAKVAVACIVETLRKIESESSLSESNWAQVAKDFFQADQLLAAEKLHEASDLCFESYRRASLMSRLKGTRKGPRWLLLHLSLIAGAVTGFGLGVSRWVSFCALQILLLSLIFWRSPFKGLDYRSMTSSLIPVWTTETPTVSIGQQAIIGIEQVVRLFVGNEPRGIVAISVGAQLLEPLITAIGLIDFLVLGFLIAFKYQRSR